MTHSTPSKGSIHQILQVSHALNAAGMNDEEAQALITTPEMAEAMLTAGRRFMEYRQPVEVGLDSSIVALKLRDHRVIQELMYFGIDRVGDLAQLTVRDLTDQRFIGIKRVQIVKDVATAHGTTLLDTEGDILNRAIAVAGDIHNIRARLMRFWQYGINHHTQHYLRKMTLGELSSMSRGEFIKGRRLASARLSTQQSGPDDTPQAEAIAQGLSTVGLSFMGE